MPDHPRGQWGHCLSASRSRSGRRELRRNLQLWDFAYKVSFCLRALQMYDVPLMSTHVLNGSETSERDYDIESIIISIIPILWPTAINVQQKVIQPKHTLFCAKTLPTHQHSNKRSSCRRWLSAESPYRTYIPKFRCSHFETDKRIHSILVG